MKEKNKNFASHMTAMECFDLADSMRDTARLYDRAGREKLKKQIQKVEGDILLSPKEALKFLSFSSRQTLWRRMNKYGIRGPSIYMSEVRYINEQERKR